MATPTNPSDSRFQLSPLYFAQVGGDPLSAQQKNDDDDGSVAVENTLLSLPSEVLPQCLTQFADWGDLAKLATVQSSWKNLLCDAAAASPQSRWQLAQAWLHGTHGLVAHPTQAKTLLTELADLKDATEEGEDDTTTDKETCRCASQARKQLAYMYLDGTIDDDDDDDDDDNPNITGLRWLERAHDIDRSGSAAYELALIYEHGKYNVLTDVVKAASWFTKSATAGHVDAMAELGLCYELGCGVPVNEEMALDWYMRASERGDTTSTFAVGEFFEEAKGGVPQSDAEACLWYYRAALKDDDDSKRALVRLLDVARIVVPGVRTLLQNGPSGWGPQQE